MSQKFGKNREVSLGYAKIPMYYTSVKHPHHKHKQLVIMDSFGLHFTACWRNNKSMKTGIEFLVKATTKGFIYKDKEYSLGYRVI